MSVVRKLEGPERIAPEWWRTTETAARDYYRIEDNEGRRFWLFRSGDYGVGACETMASGRIVLAHVSEQVRGVVEGEAGMPLPIPETTIDDEFAKDLGDFASLDALKTRVREDLAHEAKHESDRELRADLMKQLATRVTFEVPQALLEREIDRRVEEFVRRLIDQQIDPMKTNINWEEFREKQREAAAEAVRGALVLDEVARRESVGVSRDEIEAEIAKYAERTNRTPAAVRARLEKEGGIGRLYSGLRRERAIDFLLSCATIEQT